MVLSLIDNSLLNNSLFKLIDTKPNDKPKDNPPSKLLLTKK